MSKTSATSAVITGGCLLDSALFFESPCIEYWLALSQMLEAVVLYQDVYFLAANTDEPDSTVFNRPFLKTCLAEHLISIRPLDSFMPDSTWGAVFDRFSAALTTALPAPLDVGTCLDLLGDVRGRLYVEATAYHGMAHALRTEPERYYSKSPPDPQGDLRDIAMKLALFSITREAGADLISSPLDRKRTLDIYEAGVARLNLQVLSGIVESRLAEALQTSEIVSLDLGAIATVAIHRAMVNRTELLEEILRLRRDFLPYRKAMGRLVAADLSALSIEEFLSLRVKLIDEVQVELKRLWQSRGASAVLMESVDASVGDEGMDLSLSISALLKLLFKGIRSKIIRARVKPLFDLSRELKKLPVVSNASKALFGWAPSRNEIARLKQFETAGVLKIADVEYLTLAKKQFLGTHGKYGNT